MGFKLCFDLSLFIFEFMMVFHGHKDDAGEEKKIRPAERAEGKVLGEQGPGGHQENADPDAEEPDQADIVGGFAFHDTHDKRDIKKREDRSRPSTKKQHKFHKAFPFNNQAPRNKNQAIFNPQ